MVDEKTDLHLSLNPVSRKNYPRIRVITLLGCAVLLYVLGDFGNREGHRTSSTHEPLKQHSCANDGALNTLEEQYDWFSIKPSEKLEWHNCYQDKQCARLSVPLDYTAPQDAHSEKAAIALLKIPAKLSGGVNDKKYRGPVLFNPGGPGGSGVSMLAMYGELFQKILGDDYDLIGFDPRGISRTTPAFSVFETNAEAASWELQEPPLANSTGDALARMYGRSQILGRLAEARDLKTAQHVSTAVVARDMLEITRAHGRDKLLYWGFSYGSVLGSTYAAMFPDNVERLIIDGVVDVENYYATLWSNNLRDTDKVEKFFFSECAAAGPKHCAIHESTPELVRERYERILSSVKQRPIPTTRISADGISYDIVDYTAVRTALFASFYKPKALFKNLALALADLEQGNGTRFLDIKAKKPVECHCNRLPIVPRAAREVTWAIACGDGEPVNDTVEDLQAYYEKMATKFSSYADNWVDIRASCAGWNIRPIWRFTGPVVGNTSFPILLIGNTADPVTPLWSAHKVSKGFQGSVVLTQNSAGHCSLSATSVCTQKAVRAYFRDGVLPKPGTICDDVEGNVFGSDNVTSAIDSMNFEDRALYDAVKALSDGFEVSGALPGMRNAI